MRKEKCNCEYQMLITLAVGLIIGVVMGMAVYAFAYPVFQSANWAAWVQAIGSVGAIGGAIYVANFEKIQRHNERNEELRNSISTLIESMNSVQLIAIGFYELNKKLFDEEDTNHYESLFSEWLYTFRNIYLSQQRWVDRGLITSIMGVNVQLGRMLELNRDMLSGRRDSK